MCVCLQDYGTGAASFPPEHFQRRRQTQRVAVGEGMGNLALIHTLTQNLITHSIPSSNLSTSNYPYSLDNG